jgi:hypothetical protein
VRQPFGLMEGADTVPRRRGVVDIGSPSRNASAANRASTIRFWPPVAEAGVPRRWPWARLLQRVFGVEVLVCDRCGGPRRILGAVTEPHAVRRLLAALGLAAEPPPAPVLPAA